MVDFDSPSYALHGALALDAISSGRLEKGNERTKGFRASDLEGKLEPTLGERRNLLSLVEDATEHKRKNSKVNKAFNPYERRKAKKLRQLERIAEERNKSRSWKNNLRG